MNCFDYQMILISSSGNKISKCRDFHSQISHKQRDENMKFETKSMFRRDEIKPIT